jgi:hypothetical protein
MRLNELRTRRDVGCGVVGVEALVGVNRERMVTPHGQRLALSN